MAETAITMPLLVLLLLATAEFGHAFWEYSTLTKAVRDGGRFASAQGLLGSTGVVIITNQLRTDVGNIVVYGNTAGSGNPVLAGFAPGNVTIDAPGNRDVIISASYVYDPLFGVLPAFYGAVYNAPFTLDAAIRVRAL
jgi:Flp pilus assembly protein TadG